MGRAKEVTLRAVGVALAVVLAIPVWATIWAIIAVGADRHVD